jgi:hypothetical protein
VAGVSDVLRVRRRKADGKEWFWGAGFLLDVGSGDPVFVTALHVVATVEEQGEVDWGTDVRVGYWNGSEMVEAPLRRPLVHVVWQDWVAYRLDIDIPDCVRRHCATELRDDSCSWESYGWPMPVQYPDGTATNGTIQGLETPLRRLADGKRKSVVHHQLRSDDFGERWAAYGYSGAPVLVGRRVVGMITKRLEYKKKDATDDTNFGAVLALPIMNVVSALSLGELHLPKMSGSGTTRERKLPATLFLAASPSDQEPLGLEEEHNYLQDRGLAPDERPGVRPGPRGVESVPAPALFEQSFVVQLRREGAATGSGFLITNRFVVTTLSNVHADGYATSTQIDVFVPAHHTATLRWHDVECGLAILELVTPVGNSIRILRPAQKRWFARWYTRGTSATLMGGFTKRDVSAMSLWASKTPEDQLPGLVGAPIIGGARSVAYLLHALGIYTPEVVGVLTACHPDPEHEVIRIDAVDISRLPTEIDSRIPRPFPIAFFVLTLASLALSTFLIGYSVVSLLGSDHVPAPTDAPSVQAESTPYSVSVQFAHHIPYGEVFYTSPALALKKVVAVPTRHYQTHHEFHVSKDESLGPPQTHPCPLRVALTNSGEREITITKIVADVLSYSPPPPRYVVHWDPKGFEEIQVFPIQLAEDDDINVLPIDKVYRVAPGSTEVLIVDVIGGTPGIYDFSIRAVAIDGSAAISSAIDLFIPDDTDDHGIYIINVPIKSQDSTIRNLLELPAEAFEEAAAIKPSSLAGSGASPNWKTAFADDSSEIETVPP